MTRRVVIMSGIPGSGKSHYASMTYPDMHLVSADQFFTGQGGEYAFKPALLGAAHVDCFRRFLDLLQTSEAGIVVDNTNLSAWEISPYMLAAQSFGAGVLVVRIGRDPAKARQAQLHGVPDKAHESMQQRFMARDVLPWWNVREVFNNA